MLALLPGPPGRTAGPLPQDVYVWQRAWTGPVREAVGQRGRQFGSLVVLAAEVSWTPDGPRVTHADVDYALLKSLDRPVGIALRIGAYRGAFAEDDGVARMLADLSASLCSRAVAAGVTPCELQIDFDCPESKLPGYRKWVRGIKALRPGAPVTITALPSWLKRRAFAKLAREADSYVLQVHSFERPAGPDARSTLCDPNAARRAVEWAGR